MKKFLLSLVVVSCSLFFLLYPYQTIKAASSCLSKGIVVNNYSYNKSTNTVFYTVAFSGDDYEQIAVRTKSKDSGDYIAFVNNVPSIANSELKNYSSQYGISAVIYINSKDNTKGYFDYQLTSMNPPPIVYCADTVGGIRITEDGKVITQGPQASTTTSTTTGSGSTGGSITSNPVSQAKLFFAFDTMFGGTCPDYGCWITKVWAWATMIMLPLSIIMLIGAGALYATSAGNPERISLAKKIIIGVLSGLVLIVLARVLLINFVGLDSTQWNVN